MMNVEKRQPKLIVPVTGLEKTLSAVTLIAMIWFIVYVCVQWTDMPDRIPIHFNGKGQVDGWGSKWTLIILPIVSLLLYSGLTVLSKFPHVYNYPLPITEQNAAAQYLLARKLLGWINLEVVALFGYITWISVKVGKGYGDGLGLWSLPIILVVLFGTLAIYFVRAFRMK